MGRPPVILGYHGIADVVVIKGLMMVGLLVVIAGVVAAQGRSLETAAAILIVSIGIGFEYQAGRSTRCSTAESASSTWPPR